MPETSPVFGKGLLTQVQKAFLLAFARLPDQAHFYRTGGTALAEYYYGHRLSFDLDLPTASEALMLPISYQLGAIASAGPLDIKELFLGLAMRTMDELEGGGVSQLGAVRWIDTAATVEDG